MRIKKLFYIIFIIQILWSLELEHRINSFTPNSQSRNVTHIIGIMVDFQDEDIPGTSFLEDNPQTSGNGKFIETLDDDDDVQSVYTNLKIGNN